MKNSNKLLLGAFLLALIFIATMHITLYAKYKNGDYTIYNSQDDIARHSMQPFKNIRFITIQNIRGIVAGFGAVTEVEKRENNEIEYSQHGDTLIINGSNNSTPSDLWEDVELNVPYNVSMSVLKSSISFKEDEKNSENSSIISLQRSKVVFSGKTASIQFKNLKIIAEDSSAILFDHSYVGNLETQLSNSSIRCTEGNFDQLSIITDSISRISLTAKHLLKAKINSVSR